MIPLTEKFNIDLCEVVDAVNHGYPRNNIPKPSPGVGGPCLVKDPYLLKYNFDKLKINNILLSGSRKVNENTTKYLYSKLNYFLKKLEKILIIRKYLLLDLHSKVIQKLLI